MDQKNSQKFENGNPNLLQIVLDLNPYSWALLKSREKMVFEELLKGVIIFVNSYISLKTGNRLFIIAGGQNERY